MSCRTIARVGLALPIESRRAAFQAFPPWLVVGGDRDVREDRVVLNHVVRVVIRLAIGARNDTEVAGFRIDRPQRAVGTDVDPRSHVGVGSILIGRMTVAGED